MISLLTIFLLLIVLPVSVVIVVFIIASYIQDNNRKKLLSQNILLQKDLMYVSGGHPYLKANWGYKLQLKTDGTIKLIEKGFNKEYEIPLSQIINYQVQTQEELQKNITIPRVLLVGILALAIPKTTKITHKYLYLRYNDTGVTIDCLFKNNLPNEDISDIVSLLNRIKIEANKKEEITN